ncbi:MULTISPECIES: transporter substrate-binding domain-containing protein [unclassified Brenneria]|uniref:transporter substrate-binding domain-containing protein n=1 Tax=unclassified Brenneria TaxID=2634434 RepID=UPI0015532992|nr:MULTISPECIES: transporter substrate-binding domain-containing protein [unclassified Brenneria]MBJ7223956.1 transporter substrate-binding domain-containing protein [Brenneria sp. L3-3C-1]MEE3645200.1 transporter substrate-binding domain-containing protein [Brenneria sp. L3_3C_1]MEE3649917.1 transporter substrate-binding domain-containing protein [Brenneria sp. HEZEL_4_2_4]NPC99875.1 transporter substrate-binding domain-containing protein [Brenneria sp. hezel4-2-4]
MRNSIALLSVVMLALGSVSAYADKLDDIRSSGVVRIGTSLDTPPFGYQDEARNPTGLDIEMGKMVAEALGVKLQLQQVTAPNRVPYLLTGKVDIIISNLGKTPERTKQVLFTDPYVNTYIGIWGPKKIQVGNADELGKYVVAVSRGSTPDLALSASNPNAKIMRTEDDSTSVTAYLTGQADLIASTDTQIAAMAKQSPQAELDPKFRIRNSPAHMAVQQGETGLADWLNAFIKTSIENGKLDALSQKYLGKPADLGAE